MQGQLALSLHATTLRSLADRKRSVQRSARSVAVSAAAEMEAIGLAYNTSMQVIICVEHGYCLSRSTVRRHLQKLHAAKGSALKAAYDKVAGLELAEPSILEVPSGGPLILYLTIDSGFQCAATACTLDKRSISKNRNTVEKHLSEVHSIGRRPGKTPL